MKAKEFPSKEAQQAKQPHVSCTSISLPINALRKLEEGCVVFVNSTLWVFISVLDKPGLSKIRS